MRTRSNGSQHPVPFVPGEPYASELSTGRVGAKTGWCKREGKCDAFAKATTSAVEWGRGKEGIASKIPDHLHGKFDQSAKATTS